MTEDTTYARYFEQLPQFKKSPNKPYIHSDERFEALESAVLHLLGANSKLEAQQKEIIIQITALKSNVRRIQTVGDCA